MKAAEGTIESLAVQIDNEELIVAVKTTRKVVGDALNDDEVWLFVAPDNSGNASTVDVAWCYVGDDADDISDPNDSITLQSFMRISPVIEEAIAYMMVIADATFSQLRVKD